MFNFSLKILQVRSNGRNGIMIFWVTKVRFTDVSSQRFLDSQTFWSSIYKCIYLLAEVSLWTLTIDRAKFKLYFDLDTYHILLSTKNENIYLLISCVLILPVLGTAILHIQSSQLFLLIIIRYIFKSFLWK